MFVELSRGTVWVRKAAPIVDSRKSENSSRTKRRTRELLPTADSPRSTSLKEAVLTIVGMMVECKV
jgi:hypothetical protein